MRAYLEILRPYNCVMAAVAVAVGLQISGAGLAGYGSYIAMAVAFIICGFGNVINDYYDYSIDRVNRPQRAIPRGAVSPRAAYLYALALAGGGNILAFSIGVPALSLALFNFLLLYLYAWKIKKEGGLSKNVVVSYLVASPFLYGGIVAGKPYPTLILTFLAAAANTSREVVKDIEDLRGDSEVVKSLPLKMGLRGSSLVAVAFLTLAIAVSPLPYLIGLLGPYYLPLVALADLLFLSALVEILKFDPLLAGSIQRRVKVGMVVGLVAFLGGSY